MIAEGVGLMLRLRKELDKRGIDWHDESNILAHEGWYVSATYRTKWSKEGKGVSVIWGFTQNRTEDGRLMPIMALSYGWPDMLECWYRPNDSDPIPMTVEEIIETCM